MVHRVAALGCVVVLAACAPRPEEKGHAPQKAVTPMLALDEARRLPPMDLSDAQPWRQTLASSNESFCRVREGRVECWGAAYGPRPRRIARIDDALEVTMVGDRGCAFRRSERLTCWFARGAVHPGDGPLELPTVERALAGAIDWEEDGGVGCAIDAAGALRCFELCNDQGECYRRFEPLAWSGEDVALVSPSAQCPCVLTRAGALSCWGDCEAWIGMDGAGPHVVERLSGTMLFRGFFELCVARGDDRLLCRGSHLMKSTSSSDSSRASIAVLPLPSRLSAPVRAVRFVDWECLVHAEGELSCRHFWKPFERVSGVPGRVRQVAGQIGWSLCVELDGGRVACRGDGHEGQLGDGRLGPVAHSEEWVTVAPARP